MSFRIRKAEPDDVSTILELIRELADFEKLRHEVAATEEALRHTLFPPHEKQPAAEVLMAEWATQSVGFALFFTSFSTFLAKPGIYLEDLYVRPEFRSKGIGKELLRSLASLAVSRGCGRLEGSVLDWNEEAIQCYLKLGAAPMKDWTVYRLSGNSLQAVGADG